MKKARKANNPPLGAALLAPLCGQRRLGPWHLPRALVLAARLGSPAAALLGQSGCSTPLDPGGVSFIVHTTPPPDDRVLSPLLDPRVTAIELRDASRDDLLTRTRFDPPQAGMAAAGRLDLSPLPVSGARDLRMLALGAAGQQVLGVALTRNAQWSFGEQKSIALELRRPLFFFGGGGGDGVKLVPLQAPPNPVFAPIRQLFAPLQEETKLRVVDPNSVTPLLGAYDQKLDASAINPAVTAAVGTYDGQSLLVANVAGNLHVVDTLSLTDQRSVPLPSTGAMLTRAIVVDAADSSAAVLMAPTNPPMIGQSGRVVFLRNLAGLRSGQSADGDPVTADISSTAQSPVGPPLSAAFAPDGMVDVVFGRSPLQVGQPDCISLAGSGQGILRRYDPTTAMPREQLSVPYTTAVAYTAAGERVLVQPCVTPAGSTRSGQIVIQRAGGDKILPAAGVADVAATRSALIAVGRDDLADSPTTTIHATVNILESSAERWSTSQFDLSPWLVPYRITLDGSGNPYTSSLDVSFSPTDVLVYSIAVTPDRGRALALMRVEHKTRGVFVSTSGSGSSTVNCFVDWSGYTYHVLLINLQSGAREQDYVVGVQNQTCGSRSFDSTGNSLGACFTPCDNSKPQPYLIGYASGYIPSAASVLFGR